MPITVTQEVYEIRSISLQVINPSIMEGEQQHTSIIGPQRGLSIQRYAPVWLTAPVIEGDPGIPNTMFCTPGSVDASPSPARTYHFYLDGISAQNSDNPYFETNDLMDSKNLTCTVTAINQIGFASATSAPVFITLIEPVIVGEFQWFGITGLPAEESLTIFMDQIFVTTGMWIDEVVSVFEAQAFVITGMGQDEQITINHVDTYLGTFFVLLDELGVANATAEGGVGSWTVTSGTLRSVTATNRPGSFGTKVFRGSTGSGIFTAFRQDVNIVSGNHDEIDAGIAYVSLSWWCARAGTSTFDGEVKGYFSLLDASNNVLLTDDFFGFTEPDNVGTVNLWEYRATPPVQMPVGTRKVRVFFELAGGNNSTEGNVCQIDEIAVTLYKAI